MKKFKLVVATMLIAVFAFCLLFAACTVPTGQSTGGQSSQTGGGSSGGGDVDPPATITINYRDDYAPTTFSKDSISYEAQQVADGVILVKNTLEKSNGHAVIVYAIEVDLSKANIAAGTKDNVTSLSQLAKAVPSEQANAYEKATGKTVYAYLNADFFGSQPVNAFVKDGILVKDGHNDNGNYDYKNTASDVPASAPMLFGVKDGKAQIAPITSYTGDPTDPAVKQALIQSKLTQQIKLVTSDIGYDVITESDSITDGVVFNKSPVTRVAKAGSYVLKVNVSSGTSRMLVSEKINCSTDREFTPEGNVAYVFVGENSAAHSALSASVRKYLGLTIASSDGTWDGYTTILGCRQSLVENGAVASTVTLENTNGAQGTDIPRSAVGIKEDGTVVIFAVESLYYSGKNSEGDTHGMSLPQLADFMTFYGVENGANFDGGGSTQLTVLTDGTRKVYVRSSDTASYECDSTRSVINTILVTSA